MLLLPPPCRFLLDQDGARNDTFVTAYVCLGLLSIYALYCQWDRFRQEGCEGDDDAQDDDNDSSPPSSKQRPDAQPGGAGVQRQLQEGRAGSIASTTPTALPAGTPRSSVTGGAHSSSGSAGGSTKRRRA